MSCTSSSTSDILIRVMTTAAQWPISGMMLRRILMALLIVCLSVPALALPASSRGQAPDAAVEATDDHCAGHDDDPVRPAGQPAKAMHHDCIGCVVPQAPGGAVAARLPLALARTVPAPDGGVPGQGRAPETPPPRA